MFNKTILLILICNIIISCTHLNPDSREAYYSLDKLVPKSAHKMREEQLKERIFGTEYIEKTYDVQSLFR